MFQETFPALGVSAELTEALRARGIESPCGHDDIAAGSRSRARSGRRNRGIGLWCGGRVGGRGLCRHAGGNEQSERRSRGHAQQEKMSHF